MLNKAAPWIAATITAFSLNAQAQTVLNPGPGTDYMLVSCGGQTVNAVAEDFVADLPTTIVYVRTRCNLSGRGAKSSNYLVCTRVTYAPDGSSIVSSERLASGSWLVGTKNPVVCPGADPTAVSIRDGDGASLSTVALPLALAQCWRHASLD